MCSFVLIYLGLAYEDEPCYVNLDTEPQVLIIEDEWLQEDYLNKPSKNFLKHPPLMMLEFKCVYLMVNFLILKESN